MAPSFSAAVLAEADSLTESIAIPAALAVAASVFGGNDDDGDDDDDDDDVAAAAGAMPPPRAQAMIEAAADVIRGPVAGRKWDGEARRRSTTEPAFATTKAAGGGDGAVRE